MMAKPDIEILDNAFFRQVMELVPDTYKCCVAGGAAVNLDLATDIDVFVLGVSSDKEIYALTQTLQAKHIPGLEIHERGINYSGVSTHIATIKSGIFKPIQIMATRCNTIVHLLSEFDISTHCRAVDQRGNVVTIEQTTDTAQTPLLVKVRNPITAFKRYRKICLRYGLSPDMLSLHTLCTTPDQKPDDPETCAVSYRCPEEGEF